MNLPSTIDGTAHTLASLSPRETKTADLRSTDLQNQALTAAFAVAPQACLASTCSTRKWSPVRSTSPRRTRTRAREFHSNKYSGWSGRRGGKNRPVQTHKQTHNSPSHCIDLQCTLASSSLSHTTTHSSYTITPHTGVDVWGSARAMPSVLGGSTETIHAIVSGYRKRKESG